MTELNFVKEITTQRRVKLYQFHNRNFSPHGATAPCVPGRTYSRGFPITLRHTILGGTRDELSYLAPLGSENISAPYFKQCFFQGELLPPPKLSQTPRLPVPRQK